MSDIIYIKKNNYIGYIPPESDPRVPTSDDDDTKGFSRGSRWFHPDLLRVFECFDPSTGAAIWGLVSSDGLVSNKTGGLLSKLTVVRIGTPQGGFPTIEKADKSTEGTSADTIGVIMEDIADNAKGFIAKEGGIYSANTTGTPYSETWLVGDPLYLGDDGKPTNIQPSSPDHEVRLGWVITVHANNGIIFLDVKNGYETHELHDFQNLITKTTGWVAVWNDSTKLWEPKFLDHSLLANILGTGAYHLSSAEHTEATRYASTTQSGLITELATSAETDTGTDDVRAITPAALQASKENVRYLVFPIYAAGEDVVEGTNLFGNFICPVSGTILQSDSDKTKLMASVTTAGTTGTMVIDINKNGTTIMTTDKLEIESGESSTLTATDQPSLTTTTITKEDIITIDVDTEHGTVAEGLMVHMAIREN